MKLSTTKIFPNLKGWTYKGGLDNAEYVVIFFMSEMDQILKIYYRIRRCPVPLCLVPL